MKLINLLIDSQLELNSLGEELGEVLLRQGPIMLSTTKSSIVGEEAVSVVQVPEDDDDDEKAYVVGAVAEAVADVEDSDGAAAADGLPTVMNWTEYVMAYKRLSQEEISFILSRQRKPFESTAEYKNMVADGSTETKEDLEREAAEHEYAQDRLSELQERVRREYAEKGFVAVDDDANADRLELEQHFKETWARMFDELGLDDAMFDE